MIVNTGMKRDAFLRDIARHIGEPRYGEVQEGEQKIIYFGAGYWRGVWTENETGVTLFNPDNSPADARIVEQALCILLCGKFKP